MKMDPKIHPAAAVGYERSVDAYQRGRPEYLVEAVARLALELKLGPDSTLIELGAGTGKFTKALKSISAAKVIALDPVVAMREKFSQNFADIKILMGTAEEIPLAANSADAVIAAQAFHWFDGERALREIHRVLKPGGRLGLIWNARDERIGWVKALTEIVDPYEGDAPRYASMKWKKTFDASPLFSKLELAHFWYFQMSTVASVCDRIASISFISALSEEKREEILEQVKSLLNTDELTRGKESFEFPYRTDVYWCEAR